MSAPRIAPLNDLLLHPSVRIPALPSAARRFGERLFVVLSAGCFGGRHWQVGDVLVCDDQTRDGAAVILEARGHGRPRLGTRSAHGLLGDAGEACSPIRWRVAGTVVAVLRPTGREEVVREPVSGDADVEVLEGWFRIGLDAWGGVEARARAVGGAVPLRLSGEQGKARSQPGRRWPPLGQLDLFHRARARAA